MSAPIRKILQFKHPGVLKEFKWAPDLPEFGRYNLLFGWNASGKTTLSRLLKNLESRGTGEDFEDFTIGINGQTYSSLEDAGQAISVRVFNSDYIDENVDTVIGNDMAPILVLGENSIQIQDEIKKLKSELAAGREKLQEKKSIHEDLKKHFDSHCKSRASDIKNLLRSPEQSIYNYYDKGNYRNRANELQVLDDATEWKLDQEQYDNHLMQTRATQKSRIDMVNYVLPDFENIRQNVSRILSTNIVSIAIAELEKDHELANWVHEGLALHQDREVDSCLYCGQTLPADRQERLEQHFNDAYIRLKEEIDMQVTSLNLIQEEAERVSLPNSAQFYGHLADKYAQMKESFSKTTDAVRQTAESLLCDLKAKEEKPFESQQLSGGLPTMKSTAISEVNLLIQEHNRLTEEFSEQVAQSREALEKDSVATVFSEFRKYEEDLKSSNEAIKSSESKNAELDGEIADLERQISEHRKPAEELNEDLAKYLGHDAIQLEILDYGYKIVRNGVLAKALSEGEKTAIALLYFLKSLEDERFELENGVVVLDDPVSSLDSNALYLAVAFIQERTKRAAQLILLTHNFTLFKLAKRWFINVNSEWDRDGDGTAAKPARFYMLDWEYVDGTRTAKMKPLDPLLEKFESEYHFLFSQIYRASKDNRDVDLAEYYSLANVARRLLEMFLAFRSPGATGDLPNQLNSAKLSSPQIGRIVKFVHSHSHGDFVGESEHNLSMLSEGRQVMKDIMALIRAEDKAHHKAMRRLVEKAGAYA